MRVNRIETPYGRSASPADGRSKRSIGRYRCCTALLAVLLIMAVCGIIGAFLLASFHTEPAAGHSDCATTVWPVIRSPNQLGIYKSAAVAADNGFCSEIGRDVIIDGGNAVDASIAVAFCISAMNPHSAGLGGGGIFTIYNQTTNKCTVIDSRETAPSAAHKYFFDDKDSVLGYDAIATPGELHGLWTAYRLFASGRISWSKLIEPTIELLAEGRPISSAVAEAIERVVRYGTEAASWTDGGQATPTYQGDDNALRFYVNRTTGKPYQEGTVVKNALLAATLRRIADAADPVQLFYNGSMAQDLVGELRAGGSSITLADFQNYRCKVHTADVIDVPLPSADSGGGEALRVCGPPPPYSGAVAIAIVQAMNELKRRAAGENDFDSTLRWWHSLVEAGKFAYADRNRLGDPDFVPDAIQIAKQMTSARHIDWMVKSLPAQAMPVAYYNGDMTMPLDDKGTAHASVLDNQGNAVSVTTTINHYFGSKVMSPSTGIIWNNEMDDFSKPNKTDSFGLVPSPANYIEAGKRPMSSMAPLVFYDSGRNKARLVIGAAGGSRIITGVAQVAASMVASARRPTWSVKRAVDAPRLHDQLVPNSTLYETHFPLSYVSALRQLGHNMTLYGGRHSVVTAIFVSPANETIYANSDFRKGPSSYPSGF